jgi:hypothetical protein
MPLPDHLATLERADLVCLLGLAPDLEYAFRHVLIHDTAYVSLLSRQRAHWRRATLAAEQANALVYWPVILELAGLTRARGDLAQATEYRAHARQQVESMAAALPDEALRASFLATPAVLGTLPT